MDIFATKTRLLKIGFTGTIEDLKFKKTKTFVNTKWIKNIFLHETLDVVARF